MLLAFRMTVPATRTLYATFLLPPERSVCCLFPVTKNHHFSFAQLAVEAQAVHMFFTDQAAFGYTSELQHGKADVRQSLQPNDGTSDDGHH